MLFLLDGRHVQVRHLQRKGDLYYYNPSHLMRKAGYEAAPLGRDMREAIRRAAELNSGWDKDDRRQRRQGRSTYEQDSGFVYFVCAGASIKVGFSRTPDLRINALRTTAQFELVIIGVAVGSSQMEREIHRKLRAYRCNGDGREWFHDVPEVRAIISAYLERYDLKSRRVNHPMSESRSLD
jgi:hypothetical protein